MTEKKDTIPEIIQLINTNDIKGVERLLLTGQKVDLTDDNGMTGLQHASYKGQSGICKLLLDHGADVNADSHDHRYSALHFAALSGNLELTRLLLMAGAKTYHTNTLGRTAAQMAGFVGNHSIVALINNYLPQSVVDYYTVPNGLETQPKLQLTASKPLYDLIMQSNLHPVYIAISVCKSAILITHLTAARKVLELLCEKEAKRSEAVNEVICMKYHYISYILKTLEKELDKQSQKEEVIKENSLQFECLMKKWLRARPSDGVEECMDYYIRDAVKSFPYAEMPLFIQLARNMVGEVSDSSSLGTLSGSINGQRAFPDENVCSTCGLTDKHSKCAKCKTVQYCDKTCQKLHWSNHKKICGRLLQQNNKVQVKPEKALEVSTKENKDKDECENDLVKETKNCDKSIKVSANEDELPEKSNKEISKERNSPLNIKKENELSNSFACSNTIDNSDNKTELSL